MATYTSESVAPSELNNLDAGKRYVLEFEVDATAAFGDAAAAGLATSNVYKFFTPPAGLYVEDVIVEIETKEDSAAAMDIGDYLVADDSAVDADGHVDGLDLTSDPGHYMGRSSTLTNGTDPTADTFNVAYHAGKVYDGLAFLGFLVSGACDTFKGTIKVVATKLW